MTRTYYACVENIIIRINGTNFRNIFMSDIDNLKTSLAFSLTITPLVEWVNGEKGKPTNQSKGKLFFLFFTGWQAEEFGWRDEFRVKHSNVGISQSPLDMAWLCSWGEDAHSTPVDQGGASNPPLSNFAIAFQVSGRASLGRPLFWLVQFWLSIYPVGLFLASFCTPRYTFVRCCCLVFGFLLSSHLLLRNAS